jgi:hypothetical protein
MSKKFLTPVKLANLNADPAGNTGDIYFNTNLNVIKFYDGTKWSEIGTSTNAFNDIDGGTAETNDVPVLILDGGSSNVS